MAGLRSSVLRTAAAARRTLAVLQDLFAGLRPRDFSVRLWDGAEWEGDPGTANHFTLVINRPSALRSLLRGPTELALAEAYIFKDIDIEGDINAVFRAADHLIDGRRTLLERMRMGLNLLALPAPNRTTSGRRAARLDGKLHSKGRDCQAVRYHYDVSNDFYSLWLDRQMVYSCAYFHRPDEDLDRAQERKLDYLCRKLRLRPRERLLDIGCGWGALVVYAARKYGVAAKGVTVSRSQAAFAQERIRREGLSDRCSVEVCDYRDVKPAGFDKLVSVGMFEHVGEKFLQGYFRKAHSLLRPGGLFLNHGIAENRQVKPRRAGPSFVDRYVFPDGELLPVSSTAAAAETNGFEVRDVESLREHYALTLQNWVRRLEANLPAARRAADETTCRVWRLYMAGSAHGFRTGRLNVYQMLLVKPDKGRSGLPLTRNDWYRE